MIFLIAFPIALFAIWDEPRSIAPWEFLVPFALLFLACVPFMLNRVLAAHTRMTCVDSINGVIHAKRWRPFSSEVEEVLAAEVERIVFVTTDNDGYWYKALLALRSGDQMVFSQGNHYATERNNADRMLAALTLHNPRLEINDISD